MTKKKNLTIKIPIDWLKKFWIGVKNFFGHKVVKVFTKITIVVIILLGITLKWSCGSWKPKDWSCSGGYTPPAADDIQKIIKKK